MKLTARIIQNLIFASMFLMLLMGKMHAQQNMSLPEYIDTYKSVAMEEMRKHGIPASIKLGQGILESGFGNSDLAVIGHNHFGIKCHGWQGRTFYKDDDYKNECFRAYDDPLQSFRDHSLFLTSRPRYAGLFELEITDYKGWARGLRQAGYATNPRYPELLIGVIERNQLYRFDKRALADEGGRYESSPDVAETRPDRAQPYSGDEFPDIGVAREVKENNRIRYVVARRGDTPESLADEMGVWTWEIYRYNEMDRSDELTPGQIVYLQPKRRRGSQDFHIVEEGESMYEISQKYGIRLRQLYRRNRMERGTEPKPGQQLYLRGRVSN